MPTELAFDAETHTYRLDGRVLPSVTQILKGAGLIDATWYTDESRTRGSYVHAAIEMGDDLDLDTLDPVLVPYVQAWQTFLTQTGACGFVKEQRIVDQTVGYAGTFDALLVLPGQRGTTLIDVKTGACPSWAPLQLAAYARAVVLGLDDDNLPLHRAVLELRADGTFRFIQIPTNQYREDDKTWLAVVRVFQWKQQNS